MSEFENKNLLIPTNSYPDEDNRHYGGIFVKEQVRYLARHFNEIYVISPNLMTLTGTSVIMTSCF